MQPDPSATIAILRDSIAILRGLSRMMGRFGDGAPGRLSSPLAVNDLPGTSPEDATGHGVWRSLVARFVRDEEAAGSNPVTPTSWLLGSDLRKRGQSPSASPAHGHKWGITAPVANR